MRGPLGRTARRSQAIPQTSVEQRLAQVELVSGAVAIAIGALGIREVWETGRGGAASALWLFVSVLLGESALCSQRSSCVEAGQDAGGVKCSLSRYRRRRSCSRSGSCRRQVDTPDRDLRPNKRVKLAGASLLRNVGLYQAEQSRS